MLCLQYRDLPSVRGDSHCRGLILVLAVLGLLAATVVCWHAQRRVPRMLWVHGAGGRSAVSTALTPGGTPLDGYSVCAAWIEREPSVYERLLIGVGCRPHADLIYYADGETALAAGEKWDQFLIAEDSEEQGRLQEYAMRKEIERMDETNSR